MNFLLFCFCRGDNWPIDWQQATKIENLYILNPPFRFCYSISISITVFSMININSSYLWSEVTQSNNKESLRITQRFIVEQKKSNERAEKIWIEFARLINHQNSRSKKYLSAFYIGKKRGKKKSENFNHIVRGDVDDVSYSIDRPWMEHQKKKLERI